MTAPLPSTAQAKDQAKRLRADLAAQGTPIGHSTALERVAQGYGFRDWNTFAARIADRPPPALAAGLRVRGTYLSQPFTATIKSVETHLVPPRTGLRNGWVRVVLDLDEAVDVVTFDSFSNFRKRIRGVVGPQGTSAERTSDGEPHLRLFL